MVAFAPDREARNQAQNFDHVSGAVLDGVAGGSRGVICRATAGGSRAHVAGERIGSSVRLHPAILHQHLFGATMSVLLTGFGFAAIYPLVAERIGRRFTYYHPGLFNGIFSLALAGGMLAPGTLGLFADTYGIGIVAGLPLIGTCMVVGLVLMIWLESKVTGR